ncbi:TetR/AcrR family transcriptional regulator [Gordonia terrae]
MAHDPSRPYRPHRADTPRNERKAMRRRELLAAAAVMFAERGFTAVRLDDLGAAVGISGPALYRHFQNKEAVLSELLVGVSQHLLEAGTDVVRSQPDGEPALRGLIDFHVAFSIESPQLIQIQDRDLHSLPDHSRRQVRHMQRRYVQLWVDTIRSGNTRVTEAAARTQVHAVIGLLNSTPHSVTLLPLTECRRLLQRMAASALDLASDGSPIP